MEEASYQNQQESLSFLKPEEKKAPRAAFARGVSFVPVKYAAIPSTKEGLDASFLTGVSISGAVFKTDERKLSSKTLFMFTLKSLDEEDSIQVKYFAYPKEASGMEAIGAGDVIKAEGVLQYDEYTKEVVVMARKVFFISKAVRKDAVPNRFLPRAEFHVHTSFSAMDGISSATEYAAHAKELGIKAIAFTDHDNVECFPEAVKAFKGTGVRPVFGCEMSFARSSHDEKIWYGTHDRVLTSCVSPDYVGLDIETTGLSKPYDEIIEVSAVRHFPGGRREEYSSLVRLDDMSKMTDKSRGITHITDEMILSGKDEKTVLTELSAFIGDGLVIGHNATFDMGFLREKAAKCIGGGFGNDFIDTLDMAKAVYHGQMKLFGLERVAKKCGVALEEHHRATDDAECALGIFESLLKGLTVEEGKQLLGQPEEGFRPFSAVIEARSAKCASLLEASFAMDGTDFGYTDLSPEKGTKKDYLLKVRSHAQCGRLAELMESSKAKLVSAEIHGSISLSGLNALITPEIRKELGERNLIHVSVLAATQAGLKNLFRAVSLAGTDGLADGQPTITWEQIEPFRDGLLFGTSSITGASGVLFYDGAEAFGREMEDEGGRQRYDYIEVQPYTDLSLRKADYEDCMRKAYEYGKKHGIPVIADSDAHYCTPSEKESRDVLTGSVGLGGTYHPLRNKETLPQNLYSNTELPALLRGIFPKREELMEVIYANPDALLGRISPDIKVLHTKLHTPTDACFAKRGIPSVKEDLRRIAVKACADKYADASGKLPDVIQERLDRELKSIIGNGYAIVYYIAYLLVRKSNSDGYVVGSRGSVGSSFVAYLMGITEVNPLPAHYWCPKCHRVVFTKGPSDGFDLPDAKCPDCGADMEHDGHDVPFETFLGFSGDKVPDIDLNFSGDYQPQAHNFCKEMFGADHAFRAGTVSTIADRTAYGYVANYCREHGGEPRPCEIARRAESLLGTKRTTGQHPGGIIVIPDGYDVYDFSPVQYPANDPSSSWLTTHFDFHAIHDNVLKLDILGHDDPTMLKYLSDCIRERPQRFPFSSVRDIPVTDREVYSLLWPDAQGRVRSEGIPEFNTPFVTGMLRETKPSTFGEFVKISGLSHGTDVWLNNAEKLVKDREKGLTLKDCIGCRDDIMLRLIGYGMDSKDAFDVMEFVRHGYAVKKKAEWPKWQEKMKAAGVPEWFIWSCGRIQYMFPKAHACAYVISAMRIAWFKKHRPAYFYGAYLGIRGKDASMGNCIFQGREAVEKRLGEIASQEHPSDVDKNAVPALQVAAESWEDGVAVLPPRLNSSKWRDFLVSEDEKSVVASFGAVEGVGETAAKALVSEREANGPYASLGEAVKRAGLNRKAAKALEDAGCGI